jgi:hypothetical protein
MKLLKSSEARAAGRELVGELGGLWPHWEGIFEEV